MDIQASRAGIESPGDFQCYLNHFNNKQYQQLAAFYAADVIYKVGTLTLTTPQAIAEFYADFHAYVNERISVVEWAKNGDTLAAAIEAQFEPLHDYERHGLSFKAGTPLRIVSLIFYKLHNGKIRRIRMGRYIGEADEFQS